MEKIPKSRRSRHSEFARSPKLSVGSMGSERVFFDYSLRMRSSGTVDGSPRSLDVSVEPMPGSDVKPPLQRRYTNSARLTGSSDDAREIAGVARPSTATPDQSETHGDHIVTPLHGHPFNRNRAYSLDTDLRNTNDLDMTPAAEHKSRLANFRNMQQQQQKQQQRQQSPPPAPLQPNHPSPHRAIFPSSQEHSPSIARPRGSELGSEVTCGSLDKYSVLKEDDDYYDCPSTPGQHTYLADLQIKVLPSVAADLANNHHQLQPSPAHDGSFFKPVSQLDSSGSYTAPTDDDLDELDFTREELPVSCVDIIANIASITSYLLDVGSDIWVAILYFRNGHVWWFTFTMTAIVVPSLVMTVFSLSWYIQDHRIELQHRHKKISPWRWMSRCMFLFLQIAPVLRYIDALIYGLRSLKLDSNRKELTIERTHWYHQMVYEDVDSALLRLFECFMEAAPQLTLQLYIMQTNFQHGTTIFVLAQSVACISALGSLSWALVAYHKALRSSLPNKANMTKCGIVMQVCWRLFTIGARVTALSLFAAQYTYAVFILGAIHWLVMLIWILLQNTHFCRSRIQELLFNCVMALVYVFCYVNLVDGHTRLRYLFYSTVIYAENAVMMFGWYHATQSMSSDDRWYFIPAILVVFLGFFVGIAFQCTYYICCHPNNQKPRDAHKRIRLYVPCSELLESRQEEVMPLEVPWKGRKLEQCEPTQTIV